MMSHLIKIYTVPPHQDLHCLQSQQFSSLVLKDLRRVLCSILRHFVMQRYAMKKYFVVIHGDSGVFSLEALFVVQCCIDTVLCSTVCLICLTLKAPITTAADDIHKSFFILFFFSEKIRLDISCESSARQRIHMRL